jgi:signal transduction histidine kinase/DNA-binding CsgD family transcriptional regulator
MIPAPDNQEPLEEQYGFADENDDSEPLLLVVAQEDTLEALEAERRRMARELQETVISQLNLMLAQANAYEQTMTNNAQARMAVSVLSTLARQALQQARDLESKLHPMILESLGLEPALESLATQEMRAHGLQVLLSLQRLRERLPVHIELALYRATQDAVERAIRQASASQIYIRLEKRDSEIFFSIADNGFAPSGEVLGLTCQRVEGVGGAVKLNNSVYGGLEFIIRFTMEATIELTEREMEVIRLVAEGRANKEIAAMLYVSPRTVKFHLDNIYSKLGVKTRTEAAIYALRRGWVRHKSGKTD